MKKIIIAAYILLCVCLTGCGGTNQKDYGENYNQEQDAQNFSMIRNAKQNRKWILCVTGSICLFH